MQYKEELINVANSFWETKRSNKEDIINRIQVHAINQVKNGFTSFRINKLKSDDEKFLKEWADMTSANVKVVKFRCFENEKRYLIKQYLVDLKGCIEMDYESEGKTLILDEK